MDIEIWSDIACPWCYIGKRRFEKGLAGFAHADEVSVTYRSYQLDPSLPKHDPRSEREYLIAAKGMAGGQVDQMLDYVSEQAAGEGLTYDWDALVVANSFDAHRALQYAKTHGLIAELKEALLAAHFEQGRNIGDVDTLIELGVGVGLDEDELRNVLTSAAYTDEVNDDIAEARSLGVTGVPFYVINRTHGISGAQPAHMFTQALETIWEQTHPQLITIAGADEADACGPEGCD